ncbi:MAG: glycoside hydrolase family 5 protein [Bacteroidota bacterium]
MKIPFLPHSKVSAHSLIHIFCVISLLFMFSCKEQETVPDPEPDPPVSDPDMSGIGEARDISSFDLVAEMGVGWNLGNSFDVTSRDKTSWGNPITTKAVIDAVKNMGFTTLRVPITWGFHQNANAPYTIEQTYLNDVKRVVDFGFQNRMHVIINVHHDNEWVKPDASEAEKTKDRLGSLWTQLANFFQAYNDSLIFETLNEPRLEGIPEEWSGGTPEGRGFINDFHQAAVDAIRATGGNNDKRHIMIPTWAASTVPAAMTDLKIPNNDPKIIISLHSYFPWPFAGEAAIPWGTEQDKTALEGELDKIRQKWIIEEKRPVILGEWGSIDSNPLQTRIAYAEFYAKEAAERELLTIVWDDGGMFRLLNRNNLSWDFGDIASTIVNASE